ncbi:MAG: anaerobic ribonucleoside-triphosphate reductase activating protein [bacterium]
MRVNSPDPIPSNRELVLAGVVPFSSVDFPGTLAAVFFLQGCPWGCRYCHNTHLRPYHPTDNQGEWNWEKARSFLHERVGFLDGVVFSGGEPTAQSALKSAIEEARQMGYRIGLHTSGSLPDRLKTILHLLDWVGLDIKAPLDSRYDLITGMEGSAARVQASLQLILEAGIAYQLRTTVHPLLHTAQDLEDLHAQLQQLGTHPSVIQQFRSQGCEDIELIATAA